MPSIHNIILLHLWPSWVVLVFTTYNYCDEMTIQYLQVLPCQDYVINNRHIKTQGIVSHVPGETGHASTT